MPSGVFGGHELRCSRSQACHVVRVMEMTLHQCVLCCRWALSHISESQHFICTCLISFGLEQRHAFRGMQYMYEPTSCLLHLVSPVSKVWLWLCQIVHHLRYSIHVCLLAPVLCLQLLCFMCLACAQLTRTALLCGISSAYSHVANK